MRRHIIILGESTKNRAEIKAALEKRGKIVINIEEAVELYAKKCKKDEDNSKRSS